MEYLESSNATTVLEGIIERAISAQPENLHAYVVDELVAQNPDVQLPSEDEDEDGLHAPVLCAPCAARLAATGAKPACPWCNAPVAAAV